jgi:hypothetical protein
VDERRSARVGTVSGLALLAGGTALAAVTGGRHSAFATALLAMLAAGMGHALLDESRRQARRRSAGGWAAQDTINTALLAMWAAGSLAGTLLTVAGKVRAVELALAVAYAGICGYFVVERCRTIAGTATIIGGTGTVPSGAATSGNAIQSSPTASGPSTATPSTGSPSATVTANTDVIPDGYGTSNR